MRGRERETGRRRGYWATAAWLAGALVLGPGAQGGQRLFAQAGGALDVIQVRPNVHLITGAGGNVVVQTGSQGAVVVNAGEAGRSNDVLAAIKTLSSGPIRYIINTSADAHNVGGNAVLAKAGQTIISGSIGNVTLTEDLLSNSGAASVLAHENVLLRMSGATGKEAALPTDTWPTKSYTAATYSMYLNDEGIQTFYVPAAHSDGDSIVFFRRADVIMAGDLIDVDRFPVIDVQRGGSIQGEIDGLNRLLDMVIPPFPLVWQEARTYVIPGHGRVLDHADVVEYRDMVSIIRDRVQSLIDKGMTLQQVQAANPAVGFRKRYGSDTGAWTTDKFVEAIFASLTAKK